MRIQILLGELLAINPVVYEMNSFDQMTSKLTGVKPDPAGPFTAAYFLGEINKKFTGSSKVGSITVNEDVVTIDVDPNFIVDFFKTVAAIMAKFRETAEPYVDLAASAVKLYKRDKPRLDRETKKISQAFKKRWEGKPAAPKEAPVAKAPAKGAIRTIKSGKLVEVGGDTTLAVKNGKMTETPTKKAKAAKRAAIKKELIAVATAPATTVKKRAISPEVRAARVAGLAKGRAKLAEMRARGEKIERKPYKRNVTEEQREAMRKNIAKGRKRLAELRAAGVLMEKGGRPKSKKVDPARSAAAKKGVATIVAKGVDMDAKMARIRAAKGKK